MKKSDPVVYNQNVAHYRSTCRQRTRTKNEGLSDNLEIYDLIELAVVTFGSVKDCARTISFNDDNVQVMTSINLADRGKVTFTFRKANVKKRSLRLFCSETLFKINAFTGCFWDVFMVLTYKPTPNNLLDAFVRSLISSSGGYIQLSYYTHFGYPEYSGQPTGMLSNLLLGNDRIVAPLHLVKMELDILMCLYRTLPIYSFLCNTCKTFASKKIREEHVNVRIVHHFPSISFHVPQQFDDTSCASYIRFIIEIRKQADFNSSIKIPAASEDDLEEMGHRIYAKLLPTTEICRNIMNFLVC